MKVSVLLVTYNHEKFIAQAIESALMQEVDFDYEIVIAEDCSTDRTRDIIKVYQQKNSGLIRLLLAEKNYNSNAFFVRAQQICQGQYIALLEGDDYWTSPCKLKKQVEFLDNHSECAICFHNAQVIYEGGSREPWNWTPETQKEFSTLEDMWMGNFIATCSTMFCQGLIDPYPDWYVNDKVCFGDWPLHLLNAEHGRVGYIDEVMGVYRYHSGGLYSPFNQIQKLEKTLQFYHQMNTNFDYKYDQTIKVAISKYFLEWADEFNERGSLEQAKVCFQTCLTGKPLNKFISIQWLAKTWIKLYILPFIKPKSIIYQ